MVLLSWGMAAASRGADPRTDGMPDDVMTLRDASTKMEDEARRKRELVTSPDLSFDAQGYLDYFPSDESASDAVFLGHWLLSVDWPGTERLSAFVALEGQAHSTEDTERTFLDFDEAYVTLMGGPTDLRVGKQIFGWGGSFGVTPIDVLNPWDYNDYSRREKVGVYSARARYLGNNWTLEGTIVPTLSQSDDREFFPTYVTSRMPTEESAWYVPMPTQVQGTDGRMLATRYVEHGLEEPDSDVQFALRLLTVLWDWDIGLGFFHGWYNVPRTAVRNTAVNAQGDTLTIDTISIVDKQNEGTLAVSKSFGDFVFRAEGGFFDRSADNDAYPLSDDEYVQYLVGLDYTGDGFHPDHSTMFSVQWVHLVGDIPVSLRTEDAGAGSSAYDTAFANHIQPRFTYELTNDNAIELGAAFNVQDSESWIYGKAQITVAQGLQLLLGFDLFSGDSDQFFGQYRNNDKVWAGLDLAL